MLAQQNQNNFRDKLLRELCLSKPVWWHNNDKYARLIRHHSFDWTAASANTSEIPQRVKHTTGSVKNKGPVLLQAINCITSKFWAMKLRPLQASSPDKLEPPERASRGALRRAEWWRRDWHSGNRSPVRQQCLKTNLGLCRTAQCNMAV